MQALVYLVCDHIKSREHVMGNYEEDRLIRKHLTRRAGNVVF